MVRPLEIYSEEDDNKYERLRCWTKGVNIDECIIVTARFNQTDPIQYGHHNYHKLQFSENDKIVIVSCSIENSYLLFGFRL